MPLILSLTLGALVFILLVFVTFFRNLTPAMVQGGYRACAGGWYEAHLNGCATLTRIPQQPVNTYTNLAYLAAGVLAALLLQTPPSFVFAATMSYLCVGSMLYHATSTVWGGMLDVSAIFAVFSALAVYALLTLIGGGSISVWITPAAMFVVAGLAVLLLSRRFRNNIELPIGIFLGLTYLFLVLNMWLSSNWVAWQVAALSLGLFALAFVIWVFDRAHTFPIRRWGHGFWHVLTAAASGLLFYAVHLTP